MYGPNHLRSKKFIIILLMLQIVVKYQYPISIFSWLEFQIVNFVKFLLLYDMTTFSFSNLISCFSGYFPS